MPRDVGHLVVLTLWVCIATRGDVIERIKEFNAEQTSHGCSPLDVILQDVTLLLFGGVPQKTVL